MRFLVIHNYYQQPGGEDHVFAAEVSLLRQRGHAVEELIFHNKDLENLSSLRQAQITFWNFAVYRRIRETIRLHNPDIAHVHNTFPLASPAVFHALKAEGVPVVMTLHNYRLFCVNGLFFRKGEVCEACLGKLPWRGVVHGCYRDSRLASAVVAGMLTLHRAIGTWDLVDRFIALTDFARKKFIEGGIPPEKIVVKPNFVYPDPGPGEGRGGYALFVGRLSPEKGIQTLLEAWEALDGRIPLKIVGDGPLAEEVSKASQKIRGVEWLGRKPLEEVYALMGEAMFLVFPSEWYETFGRVAIEVFAKGTPVIASDIGAAGEIISHGRTGLHFRPGDPEDLAAKVEWLLCRPRELERMRREARAEYEAKYTAEKNYEQLMAIYWGVLEERGR
ncbi:MAG: glycosyltransferase [Brockia lithotrophica]|nr:glycosyltransferase [Brockia lithotrophica]